MNKKTVFIIISILLPVLLLSTAAEILLRFMPIQTSLRPQAVNIDNPVVKATPNRQFTFSRGCCFAMANTGRINNDGFVNNQDYNREETSPLIAVIGDSYIEALMVPYNKTLHGRLAQKFEPAPRIYSFAFSGAPLSQYLVWAEYAKNTYKPQAYIFNIVGNDFDESLIKYKNQGGFHYFDKVGNKVELKRIDYEVDIFRKILRQSALVQYLVYNLNARHIIYKVIDVFSTATNETPAIINNKPVQFIGNTSASTDATRITDSLDAIDSFFHFLPEKTGVDNEKILFTVDAIRQQVYGDIPADEADKSYFGIIRKAFIDKAEKLGYPVIDLQNVFEKNYEKNRRNFEFDLDYHWNEYGHQVVYEAILNSNWVNTVSSLDAGN